MRVGLYVRVSTTESAKDGYSIGEQEKRLRSYCEAKGWDVYHVYIDGGYSGANINRPALQELLHDLEQGRFDVVLVYKRESLKNELALLQKSSEANVEEIYEIAKSFEEVLESGDPDRIRFVVEELIEYIVLDDNHIKIHWTFA